MGIGEGKLPVRGQPLGWHRLLQLLGLQLLSRFLPAGPPASMCPTLPIITAQLQTKEH